MAGLGPSWFAVDQVFEGNGGWYIGSRDGFSVGPFDTRDAAQAEVRELRRQLTSRGRMRPADLGEILQVVRRVLERRHENSNRERSFGRASPARAGELPRLGYRSPRLFALYGKWYFMTREGIDVGPYPSKEAAEQGEQRLVALLCDCTTDRERRRAIFEFMTAPRA